MVLMTKLIELELTSLEEAIYQPVWVNAMVEEYELIMKNNLWEVVLRLDDLNSEYYISMLRSSSKYKNVL